MANGAHEVAVKQDTGDWQHWHGGYPAGTLKGSGKAGELAGYLAGHPSLKEADGQSFTVPGVKGPHTVTKVGPASLTIKDDEGFEQHVDLKNAASYVETGSWQPTNDSGLKVGDAIKVSGFKVNLKVGAVTPRGVHIEDPAGGKGYDVETANAVKHLKSGHWKKVAGNLPVSETRESIKPPLVGKQGAQFHDYTDEQLAAHAVLAGHGFELASQMGGWNEYDSGDGKRKVTVGKDGTWRGYEAKTSPGVAIKTQEHDPGNLGMLDSWLKGKQPSQPGSTESSTGKLTHAHLKVGDKIKTKKGTEGTISYLHTTKGGVVFKDASGEPKFAALNSITHVNGKTAAEHLAGLGSKAPLPTDPKDVAKHQAELKPEYERVLPKLTAYYNAHPDEKEKIDALDKTLNDYIYANSKSFTEDFKKK
jgi:hypothetical protein